jgi:hypothetical protein
MNITSGVAAADGSRRAAAICSHHLAGSLFDPVVIKGPGFLKEEPGPVF